MPATGTFCVVILEIGHSRRVNPVQLLLSILSLMLLAVLVTLAWMTVLSMVIEFQGQRPGYDPPRRSLLSPSDIHKDIVSLAGR